MAFAAEQLSLNETRDASVCEIGTGEGRDGRPLPALFVELVGSRAMIGFQPAWSDLVARALEPNVFLDPAFALPLFQHLRFARRPEFLLVWEADGPATFGKLLGLLPVHLPRRGRLARGLRHPQITLGVPLLDRAWGAEGFAAMLAWLASHRPDLAGLVLTAVPGEGAFYRALASPALRHLGVSVLDERRRAILRHDPARPEVAALLSPRRRKELRRQRRRLAEAGDLAYRSARSPAEIRRAAERFMALEASGWKGRRGAPLLHDPTLATFTRTMTRLMAHDNRCRIDSLEVDGRPVAMGILLLAGSRAHFWKTTFDENHAALSPGVHFALDLTQAQDEEPGLTLTDSCAVPDHPMIDRIWGDRMSVADLVITLPHQNPESWTVRFALGRETARRRLRGLLKTAYGTALRWRGCSH